ncbi:hypothetical protein DITRI_Ditri03aG0208500 [Diplodiscus trichospermus]
MSSCINSGIKKIFILTQFNSFSLNRHLARTYNFGNGVNFGDGFVEDSPWIMTFYSHGILLFPESYDEAMSHVTGSGSHSKHKEKQGRSGTKGQLMPYYSRRSVLTQMLISESCLPMNDSRASDYGLMKINGRGCIVQFAEKPKGVQVDTSISGLSEQDARRYPYIASMDFYVFKPAVFSKLLTRSYPSCNDFGSEIIAVKEHNVVDAIISHGSFLRECSVHHSIVGVRSRLESSVELEDTMMKGADYYQTESELASPQAEGRIPIGVGQYQDQLKTSCYCLLEGTAQLTGTPR